jgi:hypothetical protein
MQKDHLSSVNTVIEIRKTVDRLGPYNKHKHYLEVPKFAIIDILLLSVTSPQKNFDLKFHTWPCSVLRRWKFTVGTVKRGAVVTTSLIRTINHFGLSMRYDESYNIMPQLGISISHNGSQAS